MNKPLRILILEDRPTDAELMLREMRRAGYEPEWKRVETEPDYLAELEQGWEIILADYNLPQFTGLRALELLNERGLDIPFIIVSGTVGEDKAVAAMKAGASDYVMKDRLARLGPAVERELRDAAGRRGRREAEAALVASELRYRRLFESARDGVLILDAETGMVVDVNPFLVELLGYSREAFLGKKIWELGFLEDIVGNEANFLELQQKGYVRYEDKALQARDGRRVEVEFVSNVYLVNHRKVVQCNIRDISERKRAEAALRAAEKRYRTLFERNLAGVYRSKLDGGITECNEAFARIYGYRSREEILGRSATELYTDVGGRAVFLDRLKRERTLLNFESRGRRKDGSPFWILENASLVDCEDADSCVEGTVIDISERKRAEEELRASLRRFELLTGVAGDLLLTPEPPELVEALCRRVMDHLGCHAFFNFLADEKAGRLRLNAYAGISEEEARSIEWLDYGVAVCGRAASDSCRIVAENIGTTSDQQTELVKSYGIRAYACHPLQGGDGSVIGTLSFGTRTRDTFSADDLVLMKAVADQVTVAMIRAKALHALRDSEARYRALFEMSRDALMTLAPPSWRFTAGNPATIKMFGARDEAEFVSRAPWEYSPETQPDGRPSADKAREMIETTMATGSNSFEWTHRRLGGESFPATVQLTRLEIGGQALLQATVRDLTERKAAEAERDRLALAIDQTGDAIIITDLDGAIQYVNPAFERTTGYSGKEAIGQNPRFLKSDEQSQAFYGELWRTITGGRSWTGRLVNRRKDGTRFTADATVSPVFAADKAVSYVAVERDITDQLALEAQLRQAHKIEAIGQLAGGVAHDFNNILGVIMGYGELAQRQLGPEHPVRARVDHMLTAAQRAASLTRQLLAFSRRQVLQPKLLDLNGIVVDTQKMLGRLISEDVEVAIHAAAGLGTVKADPGQIEQIILNLAVNARDAMPKGGSLTLETANADFDEDYAAAHPPATPGRYVMLAVSDTGVGMDEETQHRIFEPFFTTKPEGEGTGLGLSTVYGIVKQSGGFIWVYSEPGRGTTFKVYLPRVDEPAEAARPAGPPAEAPRGHETVMLVEDTATLREVIRETLEDLGYTVLLASNGEEALALARGREGPIDLLLTDVVMPKLGGGDLAQLLSALRPGMRVLYMSGYTDGAISQHGVLGPEVVLLEKPFTTDKLARGVREALDRPALR